MDAFRQWLSHFIEDIELDVIIVHLSCYLTCPLGFNIICDLNFYMKLRLSWLFHYSNAT